MNEKLLKELWDAAQTYCQVYAGEWIDNDAECDPNTGEPIMPADADETLRVVTQFLKDIAG